MTLLTRYSSFTRLKHVTAWVMRFIHNCRTKGSSNRALGPVSVANLSAAETFWLSNAQTQSFHAELSDLRKNREVSNDSCFRTLHPILDSSGICVFVALSLKAVHLELVSDLTSDAFIACLRRFISRRGKPSCIWSDHGSNFVGADRELSEMVGFLKQQKANGDISDFCSAQSITWSFIPEHAPHFGGLWESTVKSMKTHLKWIVGTVKLSFEELSTILTQVEACLNSRPLVPLPNEDDGIEALTPGHFLIGRPQESLPNPPSSYRSMAVLRRWNLCQSLTQHFWERWSTDYFACLRKFTKWHHSTRNARVGDIILL